MLTGTDGSFKWPSWFHMYWGGEHQVSVPLPLSRFDTHPQARLGTLETKMATCNTKCLIWMIWQKVWDWEQSNNSPFVESIVYKMTMFFRSVHLEILKLHWYSFHITVKLKQHTLVLMLSLVTGLSECSGTILTDNKTRRWVSVNLSQNFEGLYNVICSLNSKKIYCSFYFIATIMTVENDQCLLKLLSMFEKQSLWMVIPYQY